jgi:hypothetical protein
MADPDKAVARVRAGEPAEEPTATPTDALSLEELNFEAMMPEVEATEEIAELDVFVYPEKDTPRVPDVPVDIPIEPPAVAHTPIPDPPITVDQDDTVMLEMAEIDLSTALSGMRLSNPVLPPLGTTTPAPASTPSASAPPPPAVPPPAPPPSQPAAPAEPAPDIEDVFAQMRAKTAREQQASAALKQYEQALQFIEQGLDKEAIAALEAAARVPMLRFKAAARLGRLLIDRGDLNDGVEWLERAAEAPAPSPDEGYDLLYELAGALEAQGEAARALAILMELDAEVEGYRDVRTRITYLSRVQQTESHRS